MFDVNAPNEFNVILKFWLETIITVALAGKTPPVGSSIVPQPPAAKISAFNWATLVLVVAFWINPCHVFEGQLTFKLLVFKAVAPIFIRNISLKPSSALELPESQASTKILSIWKHCEKL